MNKISKRSETPSPETEQERSGLTQQLDAFLNELAYMAALRQVLRELDSSSHDSQ